MARHGVPTPGQAIIEGMEWLKMDKAEFARRLGISEDLLEKLFEIFKQKYEGEINFE